MMRDGAMPCSMSSRGYAPASMVVCVAKIIATRRGSASSSRSSSATPVSTMPLIGTGAFAKNGVSGSSTESVLHAT